MNKENVFNLKRSSKRPTITSGAVMWMTFLAVPSVEGASNPQPSRERQMVAREAVNITTKPASRLLLEDLLRKHECNADRVVENASGSFDAYFFSDTPGKFAMITVDEDGAALLLSDRQQKISDVTELDGAFTGLADRIRRFICK